MSTWQQSTAGLWIPLQSTPYIPEEKSFKITLHYDKKEYSYTQQYKSWDEQKLLPEGLL